MNNKVIELRKYKDNNEALEASFARENSKQVNSVQQLLSLIEQAQEQCSLVLNLSNGELREAIPRLIELLHQGSPSVQKHVLEVLGGIETPEVVPHIIPYCFQPDPYLKIQAVTSLEHLGQHSAILPLKALLSDENQRVRQAATKAVKNLIDDEFLLMILANEESKADLSTGETFFDFMALFSAQELAKFAFSTTKAIYDYLQKHFEKSRKIEEQLQKTQWEAKAVVNNLFQLKRQLTQRYSESQLELDIFRNSLLSHTQERTLLPGVGQDQAKALEELKAQYEELHQKNEDYSQKIAQLLEQIETLHEQKDTLAETVTEEFPSVEAEVFEEELEEEALPAFDPGDFTLNEEVLRDLMVDSATIPSKESTSQRLSGVILIVEESSASSDYLRSLLSYAGFSNVRVFFDGRLALENVQKCHQEIRIILTARKIPQMDGLEFLSQIRAFEKGQALTPCPIVAITEEISDYKITQLTQSGASKVFHRLFIPEELVSIIFKLTGTEEPTRTSREELDLVQMAKKHLAQLRKLYKKSISLELKHLKMMESLATQESRFEDLFFGLIEFCFISGNHNSKIGMLCHQVGETGSSEFLITASFRPNEILPLDTLENNFNANDLLAEGTIQWEPENNVITIALPFRSKAYRGEAAHERFEELDDEEVFELLDELEEEGSNIQALIAQIESLCQKEPFRLFSVMDYLHDGHFVRAHREILEMLQKLDRTDVIPYLIRRFQQLHKEYKLWTVSFIAEKGIKAGFYFIISILRDPDEEVRHRALAVLLQHFDPSFLHLLMHSFVRTFKLPRTIDPAEILSRLPPKERLAFFQILLFNEKFELSIPFLFGYLKQAAPFELESIYVALAAQPSLQFLSEEQVSVLTHHFGEQQVLSRFPNITVSLLMSTAGELLEWVLDGIKPVHWVDAFKSRFVKDVKSGWEAMGPFIQEGMQEIMEHIHHAEELLFAEQMQEAEEKELYRMLHMSKGIALSLDLEILGAFYHNLETTLSRWSPKIHEKKAEVQALQQNFKQLLKVTQAASRILNVANQDASFLLDKTPFNSIFPRMEHLFNKLTTLLRKKVKLILLEEKEFYLEQGLLSSLNESLIQLLKNAVDHGMEMSEERIRQGKPEVGEIKVRIAESDDNMTITVTDDGQGLNVQKIAKRCVEKNLLTPELAKELVSDKSKQSQLYPYIFVSQFSTAEKASQVSGRGVGMDIIKSEIEKMSGKITITSETGKGSSFILQIPLKQAQIISGQGV
ncbi:ATP-binding protein [Deltaproteobacteria bacterium TL4]